MRSKLLPTWFFLVVIVNIAVAQLNKINEIKPGKVGTFEKASCVCVPFYQCDNGNVITDGSGLIDARKKSSIPQATDVPVGSQYTPPKCGNYYVCCKVPSVGPTVQPYEHRCGIRQPNGINSRILSTNNKSEAQFGEWPWQAMLLDRQSNGLNYICGGVLIDNQHVLTAAHCVHPFVFGKPTAMLIVRLGEWDTMKDNKMFPVQDRDVVSISIHPDFRNGSLWNDIAVLRLRYPVNFAPNVDTICLPTPKDRFLDKQCVVTGWGKDAYDKGKYSNVLKVVEVPVISNDRCQSMLRKTRLGEYFLLHQSFLCAGGKQGKDSCKGDGGGPLSCYRPSDGVYVLAGLVSWGIDCGQRNVPGVYVNIVHFLDWIVKVTLKPLQSYWPTLIL